MGSAQDEETYTDQRDRTRQETASPAVPSPAACTSHGQQYERQYQGSRRTEVMRIVECLTLQANQRYAQRKHQEAGFLADLFPRKAEWQRQRQGKKWERQGRSQEKFPHPKQLREHARPGT